MSKSTSPMVIGILGGIGSGKSEVARYLEKIGAPVVSGDAVGHEALHQDNIRDQVVERFGTDLLDEHGNIVRRRLAAIVFEDPQERAALEAIVHPWIKEQLRNRLEELRKSTEIPLIVLDAAIMLEAGWDDICDQLIFVDVPESLRLSRIAAQRGWSEKEVKAREEAQWSLPRKKERADVVLDNSGSVQDLHEQIQKLLTQWEIPYPGYES